MSVRKGGQGLCPPMEFLQFNFFLKQYCFCECLITFDFSFLSLLRLICLDYY